LALEEAGIETRKWWSVGCHEMPAFKKLNDKDFGNSKTVAGSYLGLPFYRGITQEEVKVVKNVVSGCL
jgi:dTDP-4-amino-4,6-dideoxygalactose transaminase